MAALNPMRLGLALLMVSRPRPGPNLFAYWIGCLTVCVPELLIPLVLLHYTSMLGSFTRSPDSTGASPVLARIQIGLGVLALTVAAVIVTRFAMQRRADPTGGGAPDAATSIALPRLLSKAQAVSAEERSVFRRLLARTHAAWQSGSLWVAWLIGIVSVPVDGILIIVAIIVASRAALGTQVSASIAFILLMYVIVESILIALVATPARAQAALRILHDWVRAHSRQIMVTLLGVVGVSQLAAGIATI